MIAFIVTLALTWDMTGMIRSMQILEYTLFALVGPKEFPAYHQRHNRGLPLLVILPSLAAFASAIVVIFTCPARLPLCASLVAAVLDLCIIIATVVREAPLHARLDRGGSSATLIRQLVQGNWIRIVLWTVNAIVLLVWTMQLLSAAS
jgi:hypothetical protein